ncbi:MAG TPA: Gfo/Idh/MocA family oxidoreductase [Acidimicrobiales bacterium]
MRVAVVGLGAVGIRAARQLASTPEVEALLLRDPRSGRADEVAAAIGAVARVDHTTELPDTDVVVLAGPCRTQVAVARDAVSKGCHVVSVSDDVGDVKSLLELGPEAEARGVSVIAGASFAPGLSCVLAAHAAGSLDRVEEIHSAALGTGGPACAVQHHAALGGRAIEWRDGGWLHTPSGSGRELCWFPEPVGAADCYRGALPGPLLLVPAFPGIARVTARVAATRRDRLTGRLPMLRPPHPEGGVGAVRVEARGWRGSVSDTVVLGVMDRPAVAAGAVAALAAVSAGSGSVRRRGAGGLAELIEPLSFLHELARRGVKAAVFEGRSLFA